jgi:regulator of replication initiation timing
MDTYERTQDLRSDAAEIDRLRAERDQAVQEALDLMAENERLHIRLAQCHSHAA